MSQSLLTSLRIWWTVVPLVTVLIYVRVVTAMTVVTGDTGLPDKLLESDESVFVFI